MDIKQLKTFICVAESGSLSRASDRLRVVQPALSRQIKLLEHELGIELFIRYARGMRLTDAGEEFLSRVSGLVRQIEQAVDDMRSSRTQVKGKVVLGMMPTVASVFAVKLLRRVQHDFPGITLHLVEGYSVHLVEWLQREQVDVSFLYGPSSDLHLRSKEILYDDIVLISPPGQPPKTGRSITLKKALDLSYTLPSWPYGVRLILNLAAKKVGLELRPVYQVDSFQIIKSMVKNGICHAFMPISSVLEEQQNGTLDIRNITSPVLKRQLILGMSPERSNRATESVIEAAMDEIARMIGNGEWPARPGSDLRSFLY